MKIEVFEHDLPEELVSIFCKEKFIGVDCETTAIDDKGNFLSYKDGTAGTRGLDPATSILSIVQLATESGDLVVFVRRPTIKSIYLKQVLTFPGNSKIIHYAIFDNKLIFGKLGYHVANPFCTRTLAKFIIPPEQSSSLMELSKTLLGSDFKFKNGQKFIFSIEHWEGDLSEEMLNYAAMDVAILGKLRLKLLEMANEQKLKYLDAAMKLIPICTEIHMNGVYFKLGMLNVPDMYGTNRNWNEYRSA